MSTNPDHTEAFAVDAAATTSDDIEALKARIAELEASHAATEDTKEAPAPVASDEHSDEEIAGYSRSVELGGLNIAFKVPSMAAVTAVTMGAVSRRSAGLGERSVVSLIELHTPEGTLERLVDEMVDPEGEFTEEDLSKLVEEMVRAAAEANSVALPGR